MINLISKINIFNENDYQDVIESSLKNRQKKISFYLNSQVIYEASKNIEVAKFILESDYLIADGYSIVWAYKRLLKKDIEKVVFTYSYIKFIRNLFIKDNTSVFFLGATEENIKKAVQEEISNFSTINIVGFHHGYFNNNSESEKIVELINKSNAEVLVVGMGCPIAEKWIIENKKELNPILIFSVGGFFDFLAKDKISAPGWMYNSGFEWIFRLIQEPRRLFKRYLFANMYFLYSTLKYILKNEKK